MKALLIAGLAIAPMVVSTAAFAQQQGVNPQKEATAKSLTQAQGGQQTSLPQSAPPATTTQATTSTQQPPMVKQMNQQGKERIETEGK
jgi:hypothetical protein